MGAVKYSLYVVQKKPYSGAVPFETFRTQRHKQCLDIIPNYVGIHRIVENSFQRFAVLAGHMDLVSLSDTVVNGFVGENRPSTPGSTPLTQRLRERSTFVGCSKLVG
jgi:hypothetical protein